ncbi:MAG: cell wall metabolism sensor histidine kinase WalK [Alicyclobacillus sp.]|nr:cell wall metabolism sensor histidine kinase WalK [Alicyclobacillus sp.]
MIRNSIVAKLWLTIVGMVCVVLLLLSLLLQQFLDNFVFEQQTKEMTRLAASIATLIRQNTDLARAEAVALQLAKVSGNAHISMAIPLATNAHLGRIYQSLPAAEQAQLRQGQPVAVRGGVMGHDTLAVFESVRPAYANGMGLIVVTQPESVLDDPMTRMRNLIVFATALGILLTTGLAFVVSKNLSRPLVQMNRAAEQMAKGNFRQRVEVVTTDEVGRLGRTFNQLAGELQQTIAALSVEKDQLSSILSSLVDGVVAADLRGRIRLMNPPARKRLQALRELTHDDDGPVETLPSGLMSMLATVVDLNQTQVRQMTWQGRVIHATMTPLYESDGTTVRGVVCVFRDITEEQKLDRLRKDFIANVSHELRTPLSMMQGYAEALLDEFGDDPEQRRELTGIIHDETLRMKRLVNDLLNLAQLESGHFHMNFARVDLNQVVGRVGRKFQALAAERGVEFGVSLPDEHPVWVWADSDRMEQVCTNLADNALRHTPSGGRVNISVTAREHTVKLRVTDTGTGIPEADLPYIWERFYKADKARTRGQSGGTGLGLAITRHIVMEHGGDIMVESCEGQGTTFTVTLPVFRNPEDEPTNHPATDDEAR